ncbi:MAG: hypothetical protein EP318_02640 [Rhodobacteraceae bacterium]|nr:MAG: hypothetical protein EP318_02640 [Paracoccaceae bacterium]
MRHIFSTRKAAERKARLAVERKLLSEDFPGLRPLNGDIVRHSESWVRMWVDNSWAVRSRCGRMYARRGMTDDGQLIWLVRHVDRKLAYHTVGHTPDMAFRRAQEGWQRCDAMKAHRREARGLIRDLLLGRARFDVSVVDAAEAPLSPVEVRGFLARMKIDRKYRISGRMAALMALIEPQMGLIIWIAHQRRARRPATAAPRAALA